MIIINNCDDYNTNKSDNKYNNDNSIIYIAKKTFMS